MHEILEMTREPTKLIIYFVVLKNRKYPFALLGVIFSPFLDHITSGAGDPSISKLNLIGSPALTFISLIGPNIALLSI